MAHAELMDRTEEVDGLSSPARPLVLYILSGYPPAVNLEAYPDQIGGAEIQARRVAQLLRQDFDVRVLAELPMQRSAPLVDDAGVRRVHLKQESGSRRALEAIARIVAAGMREPRPGIVQASQLNAMPVAAAVLSQLRRVPLVIKITGRRNLDDAVSRKQRLQIRLLGRAAAAIVTPSPSTRSAALAHGLPERKLHLISNGVDTDYFRPADADARADARAALGYGADDFVFCWIGRLHPHKGLDCVPPVWGQVEALRPNVRLLLVGEGEQAEIAQALVQCYPKSVQWLPFRADLRPIYTAADAVLLTSASEGLSNVLLEAMACGLLAVVSSAHENTDVAIGQGFIFPFDRSSPDSQRDALVEAVDRQSYRTELGAAARRQAEQNYSLRVTAERWCELYRSLLGG